MLKKIISMFILCLMLFSVVACAGTPADGDDKEVDENNPISYTTFRWGITRSDLFLPIAGNTNQGDALLARYAEIEEVYNSELIVEAYDRRDDSEILTRLSTMNEMFDFYWSNIRKIGMPMYKRGVLYALEDIGTIDAADEKWGPASYISTGILGGQHYGFFPNEWAYNPEFEGCLLFNREMLEDLSIPLPYEYQESNSWNWDNYRNVLQQVRDSSSSDSEITPWSSVAFNEDAVSMFLANGLDPVIYNENTGEYTYGFDCAEGIAVLEYMSDLRARSLYFTAGATPFIDGKCAFFSSDSSAATTVATDTLTDNNSVAASNIVYGIVTFPLGPNATEENVSACFYNTTDLNFIFNMSDNESDTIGYFMEILYAPLDGVQNWKDYCQDNVFHDDDGRDFDNYIFMLEHAKYDMSGFYTESSYDFDALYKEVIRGELSAVACFESMRETVNTEINSEMID